MDLGYIGTHSFFRKTTTSFIEQLAEVYSVTCYSRSHYDLRRPRPTLSHRRYRKPKKTFEGRFRK